MTICCQLKWFQKDRLINWLIFIACQLVFVVYTLFFFLFVSIWTESLVFCLGLFGWSWVYLSLRINFYFYKWKLKLCLIFGVFIYPNSHVNRTAGELTLLGICSIRCTALLSFSQPNWPVLTSGITYLKTTIKVCLGSNLLNHITGYFPWVFFRRITS